MTKHRKIDVNEKLIREITKYIDREKVLQIVSESLPKKDIVEALVYIWNQRNINTNIRIERVINVKYGKKEYETN